MELQARTSAVRKPVGMLAEAKEGDKMRCPRETDVYAVTMTLQDFPFCH